MKPEERQLIHDLLDEQCDARREATLLAGGRVLRARRWRRRSIQAFATVAVLGIAAIVLQRICMPQPAAVSIASAPSVPPTPTTFEENPPTAASVTDAELLAMFPDTPVALATLGNGQKKLIFLRPGDEARFVSRL